MGTGGDRGKGANGHYADPRGGGAVVVVSTGHHMPGGGGVPPALLVPTVNGRPVQIVNMPPTCSTNNNAPYGLPPTRDRPETCIVMDDLAKNGHPHPNHPCNPHPCNPHPMHPAQNPLHLLIPDTHNVNPSADTSKKDHVRSRSASEENSKNNNNNNNTNGNGGEANKSDDTRRNSSVSTSSSTTTNTKTDKVTATTTTSSTTRTVSTGGDDEEDKDQATHQDNGMGDVLQTLPSIKATQKDRTSRSVQFILAQHKVKLLTEILRLVEMYGAHRTSFFGFAGDNAEGTTVTGGGSSIHKNDTDAASLEAEDIHNDDTDGPSGTNSHHNRALKSSWIMVQESLRRQPRGSKYKRMDRPYCFRRKVMVAVQSWVDWAHFRGYPSPDTIWTIMEKRRKREGKTGSNKAGGDEILEEAVRGLPDFVQLIYKIYNESRFCCTGDAVTGAGPGGVMGDVSGDDDEDEREDGTTGASSLDGSSTGHVSTTAKDSDKGTMMMTTRCNDDTKSIATSDDCNSEQGSRKMVRVRQDSAVLTSNNSSSARAKVDESSSDKSASSANATATVPYTAAGQKRSREEAATVVQVEKLHVGVAGGGSQHHHHFQDLPFASSQQNQQTAPISALDFARTMSDLVRIEGRTSTTTTTGGEGDDSKGSSSYHASLIQSYLESSVEYQNAQTLLLNTRVRALQSMEDEADMRRLEELQEKIDKCRRQVEMEQHDGSSSSGGGTTITNPSSSVLAAYMRTRDRCLERLNR